jgi:TRAP-type C4-dicarboxylate transport system permease small subunit
MFGAAAGVRDEGHIGMESLVGLLPKSYQFWVAQIVGFFSILFGVSLVWGCASMASSVHDMTIPTLGISQAWRYTPPVIAGVLIILFSIEHLIAIYTGEEVSPSWH